MDNTGLTITSSELSMFLLEALKWAARKWIVKDPNYDFPAWTYWVGLAVLNALMPFVLVAIGVPTTDPVLTMGFPGVLMYVVRVALGALLSMGSYEVTLKQMKAYKKEVKQLP